MAATVTGHVVEVIVTLPTYSPTAVTGAGVTKHAAEVLVQASSSAARIAQHVVEIIVAGNPDGSHGDAGGSGLAATTAYGYAT
jgi:hypothetical protein